MPTSESLETKTVIHTFQDLTTRELYDILKVRAAVFIVEQNCPYQDLDDIDLKSTHIVIYCGEEIVAYSRVFKDDSSLKDKAAKPNADLWHIGRVLTTQRNKHYGLQIMRSAIEVAERLGAEQIEIEAQCYAIPFYEKVGFKVSSDEFMLDGIPHKKMIMANR